MWRPPPVFGCRQHGSRRSALPVDACFGWGRRRPSSGAKAIVGGSRARLVAEQDQNKNHVLSRDVREVNRLEDEAEREAEIDVHGMEKAVE